MSGRLIERFHSIEPSDAHYWRAINLFGRNVASYKFALAKSLLSIAKDGVISLTLDDLCEPFSLNLCEHLKVAPKQITSSGRNEFLEACGSYNNNDLSKAELLETTRRLGFKYVLDAFHVVNGKELDAKFFIDERKSLNRISLTDNILKLSSTNTGQILMQETEARWRLVETSWALGVSRNLIKADVDEDLLFTDHIKRKSVTSCRDALNGYQKGKCFYCFRAISVIQGSDELCDVDHFFPFDLQKKDIIQGIDGIWNLVLSCKDCNRGSKGKFNLIPSKELLERLNRRNEYYISSHDPLRDTILAQMGNSEKLRISFLQERYNLARSTLIHEWQPKSQDIELF